MADESKYEYMYPTTELDSIIEQIDRGITPMMNDQLQLEIKLRYKELQSELFEEDDDDDDPDIIQHREMMKKHIEKKKREARSNDIIYIKLTEEQQKTLREEMEVSIVRDNPNDIYNKSDEELYSSEDKKIIEQKLARLKNCYYNQIDYVNAINIIKEAINYSLNNDYPWMSYEEARAAFNKGEIKFSFCNLPKLYLNYQTQITDKDILKGVVTGEITLKDKRDDDNKIKKKHTGESEPVFVDYNIISKDDFNKCAELHSKGYDTPVSTIIKSKSTIYNRFSLPSGNKFNFDGKDNNNKDEPFIFDWGREGAGRDYFNMKYNKKVNVGEFMRDVNKDNDEMLNNVINSNMSDFLNSMKYNNNSQNNNRNKYNLYSTTIDVDPKTVQIEKGILSAIRASNIK